MTSSIESFYQSKNNIYIDNKINEDDELYIELSDYLFDIIEEIRLELKNISRNRQNYWREFKKKPRILSKYMNIDNDSKYNLEINKINTSNIDVITDTINSLLEKDDEKEKKINYIFISILNKFFNENKENTYYLDLILKISKSNNDMYNDLLVKFRNAVIKILDNDDSNIIEVINLYLDEDIKIIIKPYQFDHLGVFISFLYNNELFDKNELISKIFKNNNMINNILEWKPINKLALTFRIAVLINIIKFSFNTFYLKLNRDNRNELDKYLEDLVNDSNIPLKIQVNIIELTQMIAKKNSTNKKNDQQNKYSFKKSDNKRDDERNDRTGKNFSRRDEKNDKNDHSNRNDRGEKDEKKEHNFNRRSSNSSNSSNSTDNLYKFDKKNKTGRGKRYNAPGTNRRNDKKNSEYNWIQV